MPHAKALLAVLVLIAVPEITSAQQTRSNVNRGAPTNNTPAFNVPNASRVKSWNNVAEELIDKRKKLGLDEATVAKLKELATTIDERNTPAVATFDSLRTLARADNNAGQAGTLEGRSRVAMMNTTVRDIRSSRDADTEAALALIPAEKHDAAKAVLATQEQDMDRAFGPRQRAGQRPTRP